MAFICMQRGFWKKHQGISRGEKCSSYLGSVRNGGFPLKSPLLDSVKVLEKVVA